jgi:hypothetical protein
MGGIDKILRDSSPTNMREFLYLLTSISKFKHKAVVELLETCLLKIGNIIFKTITPDAEEKFYDFVVLLFEYHSSNKKIKRDTLKFVVLGLSSNNLANRNRLIEFLNSEGRLPEDKEGRLRFVLKELYNPDYEHHWLTTSAQILLSLSELSKNPEKMIFDKPLAGYVDQGVLNIGRKGRSFKNLSQPLIPLSLISMSQTGSSQMINASQMVSRLNEIELPTQSDPEQREAMLTTRLKYVYGGGQSTQEQGNMLADDDNTSVAYSAKDSESGITKLSTKSVAETLKVNSYRKEKSTKQASLGVFFRSNNYMFGSAVSQVESNRVRVYVGNRYGRQMKAQQSQFKTPTNNLLAMRQSIKTLREYRKGELPDIQIRYIDLIAPLLILCSLDPKVAQEILVPIFIEVYKTQPVINRKQNLSAIISIIVNSRSDFQVINTVQSILYNLSFEVEELKVDASLITKTGTGSLSFAGASLLIEEMLAQMLDSNRIDKYDEMINGPPASKRTLDNSGHLGKQGLLAWADEQFKIKIDDAKCQHLVMNLIELYKEMNEEDILKGLYKSLHANDSYAVDVSFLFIV